MHKMKSSLSAIGIALFICTSTACWGWGAQPIQNVIDAPIATSSPVTTARVKSAIINSGVSLGWQMTETGPGVIQGTLHLRKHTAIVDVSYSETKYSIVYRSSVNLDEKDGKIHKNYNSWVQNLNRKINAELTR